MGGLPTNEVIRWFDACLDSIASVTLTRMLTQEGFWRLCGFPLASLASFWPPVGLPLVSLGLVLALLGLLLACAGPRARIPFMHVLMSVTLVGAEGRGRILASGS